MTEVHPSWLSNGATAEQFEDEIKAVEAVHLRSIERRFGSIDYAREAGYLDEAYSSYMEIAYTRLLRRLNTCHHKRLRQVTSMCLTRTYCQECSARISERELNDR